MKISINRNTFWCDLFVNILYNNSIKNVCISPGSRSTPLTFAFAANNYFKKYILTDERNSGFFALGLAKSTNSPSVIVTTSGTAAAELYPSIIEAYYQKIPLIVCTADRPSYLRNSGANQTINQDNLFKNHIRHFLDAGLPELKNGRQKQFQNNVRKAITDAVISKGPVHINFPFEKPFEPESYTDKIETETIKNVFLYGGKILRSNHTLRNHELERIIIKKIEDAEKGIIFCGPGNYERKFFSQCAKLSEHLNFPVAADGASGFRFGNHRKENAIENFNSLIRSEKFVNKYKPDLIIQFGGAFTSNAALEYFKHIRTDKIIVNEFGDRNDPSFTAEYILKAYPENFINMILNSTAKKIKNIDWIKNITAANERINKLRKKFFEKAGFPFEGKIITELIDALPDKCSLMVSNSLPVRDLDFFAQKSKKEINIYTNRGASGIDGIISTTLGIKAGNRKLPAYLLTGDLAFIHDFNSLFNSIKFSLPIVIILINNNGGGIFESLPISGYGKIFKKYFLTPHNFEFGKPVKSLGGNYSLIKSWNGFKKQLHIAGKLKLFSVLEIKTDSHQSKLIRNKYWEAGRLEVNKFSN